MFSEKKIPFVPAMTLCVIAVVTMEDQHPLNLDKFHLYVKIVLKLSIVVNYEPVDMD